MFSIMAIKRETRSRGPPPPSSHVYRWSVCVPWIKLRNQESLVLQVNQIQDLAAQVTKALPFDDTSHYLIVCIVVKMC